MLIYITILHNLRKIALTPSILKKTDKIKTNLLPKPSKGNNINFIGNLIKFNPGRIKLKDENVLFLLLLALLISLLMINLILTLKTNSSYLLEHISASVVVSLNGIPH